MEFNKLFNCLYCRFIKQSSIHNDMLYMCRSITYPAFLYPWCQCQDQVMLISQSMQATVLLLLSCLGSHWAPAVQYHAVGPDKERHRQVGNYASLDTGGALGGLYVEVEPPSNACVCRSTCTDVTSNAHTVLWRSTCTNVELIGPSVSLQPVQSVIVKVN